MATHVVDVLKEGFKAKALPTLQKTFNSDLFSYGGPYGSLSVTLLKLTALKNRGKGKVWPFETNFSFMYSF